MADNKKLTAEEIKGVIGAMTPQEFGRMIHAWAGRHDGAAEFAELWPSILALTEDEKTQIRVDLLGFPR